MPRHNNCQCEHTNHFDGSKHVYGESFDQTVPVLTIMGAFYVCADCSSTCYGPDSGVRATNIRVGTADDQVIAEARARKLNEDQDDKSLA